MKHIKPAITEERIEQINAMIRKNPGWNRTAISVALCEMWEWKSPTGQIKDISCRDVLRALDKAGKIKLPAAQRMGHPPGGGRDKIDILSHNTEAVTGKLSEFMPLSITIAVTKDELRVFKSYIKQYHYLGYDRSIGEGQKYIVTSKDGIPLACLMFGSAAWSCRARDEYIGWTREIRPVSLHLMTNNSRFLIFPWVRVEHLASHILSRIAHRISDDWQKKYGHPVLALETFVERGRFQGTCYKAANWIYVGDTSGLGRDSVTSKPTLPVKAIWLYPLRSNAFAMLRGSV
jgi:hypothetical protein